MLWALLAWAPVLLHRGYATSALQSIALFTALRGSAVGGSGAWVSPVAPRGGWRAYTVSEDAACVTVLPVDWCWLVHWPARFFWSLRTSAAIGGKQNTISGGMVWL